MHPIWIVQIIQKGEGIDNEGTSEVCGCLFHHSPAAMCFVFAIMRRVSATSSLPRTSCQHAKWHCQHLNAAPPPFTLTVFVAQLRPPHATIKCTHHTHPRPLQNANTAAYVVSIHLAG